MLSAKEIVEDCAGYGTVLRAWEGTRTIDGRLEVPVSFGPLSMGDAGKFTLAIHALLEINRPITIYRFYETSGLTAPPVAQHNSYISGSRRNRVPVGMLGGWWSPRRPSLIIEGLGYSSEHRQDDRRGVAANKEWDRFDACVEATLQPGSLVYAGRTALQAENRAFETDHGRTILYLRGAIQFILIHGRYSLHRAREYHIR